MKESKFRFTKAAQALLLALLIIPYLSSCGGDDDPPKSDLKVMTNVRVAAGTQEFIPVLQTDGTTWNFLLPLGVDKEILKDATVTFRVSEGATSSVESGSDVDLRSPVNITVTAEDGSFAIYTIAKVDGTSDQANITEFYVIIEGEEIECDVDATNREITIPFLPDADLSNVATRIVLSLGATSVPASGTPKNFTAPVEYEVTAHNQTTKLTWTVVRITSDQANITDFSLQLSEEVTLEGAIDNVNFTISLNAGYAQKALLDGAVPIFTLSPGASADPESGTPQNFSEPVEYTVTAYDGTTTRKWTVEVEVEEQPEVQILGRTGPAEDEWIWKLHETGSVVSNFSNARLRGEMVRFSSGSGFDMVHDRRGPGLPTYTLDRNNRWYVLGHSLAHFTTHDNTQTTAANISTYPLLYPQYFTIDMGRPASYTRLKVWERDRTATTPLYAASPWYEYEVWGANEVKPVLPITTAGDENSIANLNYWTSWDGGSTYPTLRGTDQWQKEGWELLAECKVTFPSGRDASIQLDVAGNPSSEITDPLDREYFLNGYDFKVKEEMQSKPFRYLRFVLKKQAVTINPNPSFYGAGLEWQELEFYGRYAE